MSRAVVLTEPERFNVTETAKALGAARGVPYLDLVAEVKRSWGVLGWSLAEPAAAELVEKLKAKGLAAAAIPTSSLVEPPPATPAGSLSWTERPWQEASLVAAAVFREVTLKTVTTKEGPSLQQKMMKAGAMLATGLPLPIGGKSKVVKKTVEDAELVYYVDIVFPSGPRLRIEGRKFDYGCLGAKKGVDSFGNFRQLVFELCERAKGASRNRGARTLLEGRPVREMGYDSLEDLDRESLWLLTLRGLRG